MRNRCYIFGGGALQFAYIAAVADLGYDVVLFDRDPKCLGALAAEDFAAISYSDEGLVREWARRWPHFQDGDRVFTAASHHAWEACAWLAEQAEETHGVTIPCPSLRTITGCLDKRIFYNKARRHGLDVPKWWIYDGTLPEDGDINAAWWIKSDYGKSPTYIWRVTNVMRAFDIGPSLPTEKDTWYRNVFLAQEEVAGAYVRVIISPFGIFAFYADGTPIESVACLALLPQFKRLKEYAEKAGLQDIVVKFDVIIADNEKMWVLDIGLDPPNRLRGFCDGLRNVRKTTGAHDFCEVYTRAYMQPGSVTPEIFAREFGWEING